MQSLRNIFDVKSQLDAISETQAVITFTPDGKVRWANANFLKTLGYTLEEVRDRHHATFMPPGTADKPDYTAFWADLRAGRFRSGEFERAHKDGRILTLQATYSPSATAAAR